MSNPWNVGINEDGLHITVQEGDFSFQIMVPWLLIIEAISKFPNIREGINEELPDDIIKEADRLFDNLESILGNKKKDD